MEVTVMKLGEDFQICLAGGEKPHIGCVVQAVPRESLTGDGSWSATSSVWNRTGHKDEVLCRMLAEKICCACRTVTAPVACISMKLPESRSGRLWMR